MSIINQLASSLGRRDEVPNQELANQILQNPSQGDIEELIANLKNKDKDIQNDCIKVLYEIGDKNPTLISNYVDNFIDELDSKNNRMVWGAMTALGSIVELKPTEIWARIDEVIAANNIGSVITQDWGVRVLASLSAKDSKYEEKLFPVLLAFISKCPAKDLPKHAESILIALNNKNKEEFKKRVIKRETELKRSQMQRVKKLFKTIAKIG